MAFWLVMMTLLLEREVFVRYAGQGTGAQASFDTWMGIYPSAESREKNRIGFVHTRSIRATRDGVSGSTLSMTAKLSTVMLSIPTEIVVTGTAWNPDEAGLAEFDIKIRSFDHTMRVSGALEAGKLKLEIQTAGERYPIEIPVGRDLFLSGSMGATSVNLPDLKVGEEVMIDTFDPLTLAAGKARIACLGKQIIDIAGEKVDTKIITATLSGITTKFWVTSSGETVRIETPYGLTFKKITREQALRALDRSGTEELLNVMAVRPTGRRPFRGAKRMLVRLSGLPPTVHPPSDATQQRTDDGNLYEITSPAPPSSSSGVAQDLENLAAYLEGDPFVQAGHPKIVEQAERILGTTEDPWEKAILLYQWVYENIDKTIVLSFPSALEVLESKEGDCNEHTVLYTALARSAGLPTRIAIGVVWSGDLNGFYYHAWPEVFVERWIGIDPTLGQPIADATHLKLLTGNIEKWPQLVPYLGQLQVEVLEIQ